jgi:hypothetical protein
VIKLDPAMRFSALIAAREIAIAGSAFSARTSAGFYGRVSRRAEKRKRLGSENGRSWTDRRSRRSNESDERRPNVPTFEYLYARRPLSRILIHRREDREGSRVCPLAMACARRRFSAYTHTHEKQRVGGRVSRNSKIRRMSLSV